MKEYAMYRPSHGSSWIEDHGTYRRLWPVKVMDSKGNVKEIIEPENFIKWKTRFNPENGKKKKYRMMAYKRRS